MSTPRNCPDCGTPLPDNAPKGLCPRCLMELAGTSHGTSPTTPLPDNTAPTVKDNSTPRAEHQESQFQIQKVRYFGDYELLEEIAHGGMGVVWKARQVSLNRFVALKMIRSGQFATTKEIVRFRIEAEAAANLNDKNIVTIYETGEHEGQQYFSMELIQGGSLADQLAGKPVEPRRAAPILAIVARAVHYAHQRGVIHRDLKPSNILLDASDQPHLTDFGLAKLVGRGPGLTETGSVLGTLAYMAPEQAEGESRDVTTAADFYSLGAILYEMLTGQTPFVGATKAALIRQILTEDPKPPRALNPNVDADLETICLKCLEKKPQHRPASADAIAVQLTKWMEGKPIDWRPISQVEKITKWIRRHPAVAGLSAAVVLTLLAGLAGILWQWRQTAAAQLLASQKAVAEASARKKADQMLQRMQLQRAEELLDAGNTPTALADLSRMLRLDPSNHVAADRLLSALSQRAFVFPTTKVLDPPEGIFSASFTSDGQHVITFGTSDSVCIWDAHHGKPLTKPFKPDGPVRVRSFNNESVCFISADESSTKAPEIVSTNLRVTWVDIPKRKDSPLPGATAPASRTVQIPLKVPKHRILCLSDDCSQLLTVSEDNVAWLWDTKTGSLLRQFPRQENFLITAAIDPDCEKIVLVAVEGASLLNTRATTAAAIPLDEAEHTYVFRFSPNGQWIVGWGHLNQIAIWNQHGEYIGAIDHDSGATAHWERIKAGYPAFSPDGNYLISTGVGTTLRVWNIRTCTPMIPELLHFEGTYKVQALGDLRHDNRWLASVVPDYRAGIWIWNIALAKPLNAPIDALCDRILFSPGGRQLLSSPDSRTGQSYIAEESSDRSANLWQFRDDKDAWLPTRYDNVIGSVEFVRGANHLLVLRKDAAGLLGLFDLEADTFLTKIPPGHTDVERGRISPDGRRFVTRHSGGKLCVWDAQSGNLIQTFSGLGDSIGFVEFSCDARKLLAVYDHSEHSHSELGLVHVWDVDTGQLLSSKTRLGEWSVDYCYVAFSQDGVMAATASQEGSVRVYETQSGEAVMPPLRHGSRVDFVQFSPASDQLLTTAVNEANVWDLKTGRACFPALTHERHFVENHMEQYQKMHACFSLDGQWIATASGYTARVWNARTGEPLVEPIKHPTWVNSVEFSPDGTRLVTTCQDGGARVWDTDTGFLLTEPFKNDASHNEFSGHLSQNGRWLVTQRWGGRNEIELRVWEVPAAPLPVPNWVPELTEALGGQRWNDKGMPEAVPWQKALAIRDRLAHQPKSDYYSRWMEWLFNEEDSRPVSPSAKLTVAEWRQQLERQ